MWVYVGVHICARVCVLCVCVCMTFTGIYRCRTSKMYCLLRSAAGACAFLLAVLAAYCSMLLS